LGPDDRHCGRSSLSADPLDGGVTMKIEILEEAELPADITRLVELGLAPASNKSLQPTGWGVAATGLGYNTK